MTSDCQTTIRNKLKDQNIRVACIGPAGEKLSKMAGIVNEMRAFGRKGMGAIMGFQEPEGHRHKGRTTRETG